MELCPGVHGGAELREEKRLCEDSYTPAVGRVEKSKNARNLIAYCFSNGCIETEGNFFLQKNIFDGWNWTRNLGFGHFQRFLHFFLSGKKSNSF